MSNQPTIFVTACDVSADQNAARLAAAIRRRMPEVRLVGAGGPAMREAGVVVQVSTTHLSFTGVLGSLRLGGQLYRLFRQIQRLVLETRPDLVVLTDAEMFSVPFALWLRRRGIPASFFFPPQVWLWGRWRLPLIVPLAKRVLSAFRPEAEMYDRAGADTVWIGHPLRDLVSAADDGDAAMQALGLDPGRPLVALMPGSRQSEIRTLCDPFLSAAEILQRRCPELQFAVPLACESLRREIAARLARSALRDVVVYRPDSYAVLSRARVVLQCSGTATLETALLGIPCVIAYRCIQLEYLFARGIMRVPFIGMPNILLDEMVQPEFFHRRVDAEHLAAEAWSLLVDRQRRAAIQTRLADLPMVLGQPGAMQRAADALVDLLPQDALAGQADLLRGVGQDREPLRRRERLPAGAPTAAVTEPVRGRSLPKALETN